LERKQNPVLMSEDLFLSRFCYIKFLQDLIVLIPRTVLNVSPHHNGVEKGIEGHIFNGKSVSRKTTHTPS